jgi:hypothetical protein
MSLEEQVYRAHKKFCEIFYNNSLPVTSEMARIQRRQSIRLLLNDDGTVETEYILNKSDAEYYEQLKYTLNLIRERALKESRYNL